MKKTEILKLKNMLDNANIPYSYEEDEIFEGVQITISKNGKRLCDVIINGLSYGHEDGLLEIKNALTTYEYKYNDVKGYLTAEEVFERFKYCYEHDTKIYETDPLAHTPRFRELMKLKDMLFNEKIPYEFTEGATIIMNINKCIICCAFSDDNGLIEVEDCSSKITRNLKAKKAFELFKNKYEEVERNDT